MIDPTRLAQFGTPWCVRVSLAVDDTLVIPKPIHVGPNDASGRPSHIEKHGIVVTDIFYSYVAGAASVGFDLLAIDDAFVPGTTSTFTVWSERSQAAGRVAFAVNGLWIPLSLADYRTTPCEGAYLTLDVTNTAPTSGFLLVQGVHTSDDFGRHCYSGSPQLTW